jgi:hypothetical protein
LAYNVQTYLTAGDTAGITGFVEGDTIWWFIQIDGSETTCWISDLIVSVQGNIDELPQLTPPPLPTASLTPTLVDGGVFYYLVAENTGGPFACGDSLLRVYPGIAKTGDIETDLRSAMNAMFSNSHHHYNGLLNPLHASSLWFADAAFQGSELHVRLRGDLVRPKDDCESKRMYAQVWQTIFHNSGQDRAVVWLNQALFADLLVVIK